MSMKELMLLLVLFCALTEQGRLTKKEMNDIGEFCLKEVGMEKSRVLEYMKSLKFQKYDVKYMEFLACSYKKQGYQSELGEMLFDNLKEFLKEFHSAEEVNTIVDPCKEVKGKNHGENAFYVMVCLLENMQNLKKTKN